MGFISNPTPIQLVGGAGAYLGGARSPAEILMGVAAGAMVGALNHELHVAKTNAERAKLAKLTAQYEANESKINAYISVGNALLESTDYGGILTLIKEEMYYSYSPENKDQGVVAYTQAVEILSNIVSAGGSVTALTAMRASAVCNLESIRLQSINWVIEYKISGIDTNAYYKYVAPWKIHNGSGGSGSGSSFY